MSTTSISGSAIEFLVAAVGAGYEQLRSFSPGEFEIGVRQGGDFDESQPAHRLNVVRAHKTRSDDSVTQALHAPSSGRDQDLQAALALARVETPVPTWRAAARRIRGRSTSPCLGRKCS